MTRKGFKMFLYPGMAEEYERRHNELWPEMKEMIRRHGGKNYSIFLDRETNVLYGYLEVEDEALFFRAVRASFAMRRKTLLNGLTSAFGGQLTRDQLAGAIAACGFPPAVRGETLGIPEFAALARELGRLL